MKAILSIGFVFLCSLVHTQSLIISEVVSKNSNGIEDSTGDTPDWIELLNISEDSLWLDQFYLSDDKDWLDKWKCPPIWLKSNEYIYVLASGKDSIGQFFHTNFKIKRSGEAIYISEQNQGTIQEIDRMNPICIPSDFSAGRLDVNGAFIILSNPTAGQLNDAESSYIMPKDSISWSLEPGFYNDDQFLSLSSHLPSEMRYNSSGGFSDADDVIYDVPILISSTSIPDLSLALVSSAEKWKVPTLPIARAMVISATPYHLSCPIGAPENRTFFVKPTAQHMYPAIISLSLDKESFVGSEGIYVTGSTGENFLKRGKSWEVAAFMEYFEAGQRILRAPVGIRIHGFGSRNDPHKSLRVYLRDEYGKKSIKNKFWNNRSSAIDIQSFVLNSGQSDFTKSLLKDHFAASVLEGLKLDDQKSKLVTVFINGEYWGLQFIQEHISPNHLASVFGVQADDVNIIEDDGIVKEGISETYEKLMSFILENDLRQESNYLFVKSLMDIDNFIDYNLVNLYFSNWDWPENNVKIWNTRSNDFGMLRWVLTDCDACFYVSDYNSMNTLLEKGGQQMQNTSEHHILLSKLLTNQKFQQKFKTRVYELMESNFNPSYLLHILDSIANEIEVFLPEHIARWHYPESMEAWNAQMEEMEYFVVSRHTYFINQLEKNFNIPFFVYPNPVHAVINLPAEASTLQLNYKIYSFMGALVKQGSNQGSSSIDVKDFESGTYVLRFETASGLSWSQSVIVIE